MNSLIVEDTLWQSKFSTTDFQMPLDFVNMWWIIWSNIMAVSVDGIFG